MSNGTKEVTICEVASCDRPSDGWIVCATCGRRLAEVLSDMGWMLEELDNVITGQVRYVSQPSAKSAETPMPFDPKASDTRAYLTAEISTSVRLIEDANGWESGATTDRAAAAWLAHRVSAVRLHVAGGEIVDGIMCWWAAAQLVIDRPLQRQFLGDCAVDPDGQACGGRIYGRAGKPEARCDTCGGVYQAEALRALLLKELDDRMCTAAETARLSTYLGLTQTRDQVRKRINQWASRGQVEKHEVKGEVAFRFGELYPRLLLEEEKRHANGKAS